MIVVRSRLLALQLTNIMMTRIYLLLTGLTYLGLAIWCTVAPESTSRKVGFSLNGDSGASEFMTVYGGLEFGLALILLLPFVRPEMESFSLLSCLLIHGSLVLFRGASLMIYRDFGSFTGRLAVCEWVILLAGLAVYGLSLRNSAAAS